MPTDVDVAIVGGGPAGAATAHFLAGRGHSVLVCEKKAFPREKTCGDGLTPRAVKVLDEMGLSEELGTWERVKGLRIHGAGRTLELPWPKLDRWPDYGLVKPRKDLDQIVLSQAERAGAKVLYETTVKQFLFEDGACAGVVAKRDDQLEEVRAKWVVCAEGAATKLTRSLGRERRADYPLGIALRQYFRSPMEHSGWFDAYLEVRNKDEILPGYGWVFPIGDGTVNVGVGLLSTFGGWRQLNLHRLQQAFVSGLSPDMGINYASVCSKERGGRLFMGQSVWPPHGPGFLLVGDAAGMINPCNGEGIAYGYETGRIAGRHIDEALRSGSSLELDAYGEELKDVYGPYYRMGRKFVKLIGNPVFMDRLVSVGMMSRSAMDFALTFLGNLEDIKSKRSHQFGLRVLRRLSEMRP